MRGFAMMKRTLIRCVMLFFVGIAAIHAGATEPWNGEPGVVHLASPAPGGRYDGFMVHRDDGSVIMFGAKEARLSISAGDTWGEPFKLRTADDKEISHNCRAALKLQSDKIGLVTGRQGILHHIQQGQRMTVKMSLSAAPHIRKSTGFGWLC